MTTSDNTTHATTLDHHIESLQDALHTLQKASHLGVLTPETYRVTLQSLTANLTRDYPPENSPAMEADVEELLTGFWERMSARKVAAPTGLRGLDNALNGGFQKGRLFTLLGAPGGGKTSLANQWAEQVAQARPVLYVTSEDSADVLLAKTLSRVGNVPYSHVLYGKDEHKPAVNAAIECLARRSSAHNLRYLDVSGCSISLDELRDRAAAHFEGQQGPALLVVDYLQRMARATRDTSGAKDLREAVTTLTERLRAIAVSLDCCVLAIASMNRQSNYSKVSDESALSSAKESGDIEYTADVMAVLTEDNSKNQRITASFIEPRILRIAKNRQGPVSSLKLDWRADRQQFTEVAQEV